MRCSFQPLRVGLEAVAVAHTSGLVYVLSHIVKVRLSRYLLDNRSEYYEAAVGVSGPSTRLKFERCFVKQREIVLDRSNTILRCAFKHRSKEITDTGFHREQMSDADFRPSIRAGIVR